MVIILVIPSPSNGVQTWCIIWIQVFGINIQYNRGEWLFACLHVEHKWDIELHWWEFNLTMLIELATSGCVL